MKKIVLIILLIFSFCVFSNAQYSVNKHIYDYRNYKKSYQSKYNPVIAGYASYLFPGLGQLYCNEEIRALKFAAAYIGSGTIMAGSGLYIFFNLNLGNNRVNPIYSSIFFASFSTCIYIYLYSIVDAVRVAKINSMAFADNNKVGFNFKIKPYLNNTFNNKFDKGLTLSFQF